MGNLAKTKIFLTGFRGAGKTTLAELLAEKLNPVRNLKRNAFGITLESKISNGVNFESIEMDELIVKRAGKSIAEITKDGKDWYNFRVLENKALKELLEKEKIVVATGGGLFVNDIEFSKGLTFGEYNFKLVKDIPDKLIIFLKVQEQELRKRLARGKNYNKNWRPSLTGAKNDFEENIKIYRQRLPLYEKRSDFVVDTSNQTPEESLNEILKCIRNASCNRSADCLG